MLEYFALIIKKINSLFPSTYFIIFLKNRYILLLKKFVRLGKLFFSLILQIKIYRYE